MNIQEEKTKIARHIIKDELKFTMLYPKEVCIGDKLDTLMDYVEENGYRCLPIEDGDEKGFKAAKIMYEDVIIKK